MSKSLEELQREYEKNTVKLEQEKRKLRRLENRKSYLDSGSRKQRSHRLITRGAAIESVMPEVKILTEQEFYSLMERIAEWQPVQNMVRLKITASRRMVTDDGALSFNGQPDQTQRRTERHCRRSLPGRGVSLQ